MLYDERWDAKVGLSPACPAKHGVQSRERQLLLDAADYMEKHGWCRGQLCDDEGRVCLEGALYRMSGSFGSRIDVEIRPAAGHLLRAFLKTSPSVWNDHACKSKQEAVAALRGAARA